VDSAGEEAAVDAVEEVLVLVGEDTGF